jgi:hypothetical protein
MHAYIRTGWCRSHDVLEMKTDTNIFFPYDFGFNFVSFRFMPAFTNAFTSTYVSTIVLYVFVIATFMLIRLIFDSLLVCPDFCVNPYRLCTNTLHHWS